MWGSTPHFEIGGFDLSYFQNMPHPHNHWSTNSAALKWFRDSTQVQSPEHNCVIFDVDEPAYIPKIIHPNNSMDYTWDWDVEMKWDWREMVGQMTDESQHYLLNFEVDDDVLVEVPKDRSCGEPTAETVGNSSGGAACELQPLTRVAANRRRGAHKLMSCLLMRSDNYDVRLTTALGKQKGSPPRYISGISCCAATMVSNSGFIQIGRIPKSL